MLRVFVMLFIIQTISWSQIGHVGAVQGHAELKRGSIVSTITNGMPIENKDEITTQKSARVQVLLSDDTVVTIGPFSTFVFDAYSLGDETDSELRMHIYRGFFRAVTGKIGKIAPERFIIKTGSASIGIRGTDLSALVLAGHETIRCHQGTIWVQIAEDKYSVEAGMLLDYHDGVVSIFPMEHIRDDQEKAPLRDGDVYEEKDMERKSAMDISDLTQQEVVQQILENEDETLHIDEPEIDFHYRVPQ